MYWLFYDEQIHSHQKHFPVQSADCLLEAIELFAMSMLDTTCTVNTKLHQHLSACHFNQSIKTHFYSAICRERIRGVYCAFVHVCLTFTNCCFTTAPLSDCSNSCIVSLTVIRVFVYFLKTFFDRPILSIICFSLFVMHMTLSRMKSAVFI